MSHPANGTVLAPCARCQAFSGVFSKVEADDWAIGWREK
jgi:hypothetical protein